MSVYISNDEFDLDINKVYIDVSFITPGYREGKYVHLLYNKCEIYGRVHSVIENEIIRLSRTAGGISLDDLNFIKVPVLINDFGSSECEYKIHVYFNTVHESIAKAFAEKLQKEHIFDEEKLIIDDVHLGYFYKSYDDIRATLADDKTVELENIRKEAKDWQRKYERLLKKCQSFASDIDREV